MKPSQTSARQSRRVIGLAAGRRPAHHAIAMKNGAENSMRSASSVTASTGCHA